MQDKLYYLGVNELVMSQISDELSNGDRRCPPDL